ncbi:hypothetical protein [Sphingomonas faeni]
MIEQRVAAALEQAFAKATAMALQIVPPDVSVFVRIGYFAMLAHPWAIA